MPFASSAHASAIETGSGICERCGAPFTAEDWLCAHCGQPLRADRRAAVRVWLRAAHQQLETLNSALAWLLLICWAAFPLVVLGISVAGEPHWSKWLVGLLLAALYQPVWTSAIFTAQDFGLALIGVVALMVWKLPPWLVVVGSGAAGWLLSLTV